MSSGKWRPFCFETIRNNDVYSFQHAHKYLDGYSFQHAHKYLDGSHIMIIFVFQNAKKCFAVLSRYAAYMILNISLTFRVNTKYIVLLCNDLNFH